MLSDNLLWTKIGRIVVLLAQRLDTSPAKAFDLFYESKTCADLHNPDTLLYLMSDKYIVDDFILSLR